MEPKFDVEGSNFTSIKGKGNWSYIHQHRLKQCTNKKSMGGFGTLFKVVEEHPVPHQIGVDICYMWCMLWVWWDRNYTHTRISPWEITILQSEHVPHLRYLILVIFVRTLSKVTGQFILDLLSVDLIYKRCRWNFFQMFKI